MNGEQQAAESGKVGADFVSLFENSQDGLWAKCLQYNHEDPSVDLKHPCKAGPRGASL